MNIMLRRCGVVAGIILSGAGAAIASSGSYVIDNFDGYGNGDVLSGKVQWVATDPSVMITNIAGSAHSTPNAALIPILQNLTNTVSMATLSNIVWSDFWTIPRPFQSTTDTAPAVDTNATAQLFVSNGWWVAISKDGGGNLVTNSLVTGIPGYGALQQVTNDGTSWCHVSICHDYSNKVWSLFVGGVPVATNLGFINKGVSNYQWFAVQNGGGDSSNKTFLDDVLITNVVPASLTVTNSYGLRAAWALATYGNLNPPVSGSADSDSNGYTAAEESAMGGAPAVTPEVFAFGTNNARILSMDLASPASPAMQLAFVVGANRTNYILGSSDPNGTFSTHVGQFYTGPNGETNTFVDTNALARGNRYFYEVSSVDNSGVVSRTNTTKYAWYKQSRGQAVGTYYWVGIPVDYGTNNALDKALGTQLARGLQGGDLGFGDTLTIYYPVQKQFYLKAGSWLAVSDDRPGTNILPRGHAVLIHKDVAGTSDGATNGVFAGLALGNFTNQIAIGSGWNLLCWPEDASNKVWSLNGHPNDANPLAADRMWIPGRNGKPAKQLRMWTTGWQFEPKTGVAPSNDPTWAYLQPGEACFYTNSGAQIDWAP